MLQCIGSDKLVVVLQLAAVTCPLKVQLRQSHGPHRECTLLWCVPRDQAAHDVAKEGYVARKQRKCSKCQSMIDAHEETKVTPHNVAAEPVSRCFIQQVRIFSNSNASDCSAFTVLKKRRFIHWINFFSI
jgi:hypothetical protein